jgi:DNA repair exonuclease SbcCD ATPase subunit
MLQVSAVNHSLITVQALQAVCKAAGFPRVTSVIGLQAADLAAQLATLDIEKAETVSALETMQAELSAANAAVAEAAAAAAQVLAQAEAHKKDLEGQVAALTQAAQEHASYQQELEGKAMRAIQWSKLVHDFGEVPEYCMVHAMLMQSLQNTSSIFSCRG